MNKLVPKTMVHLIRKVSDYYRSCDNIRPEIIYIIGTRDKALEWRKPQVLVSDLGFISVNETKTLLIPATANSCAAYLLEFRSGF